MRSELQRMRVLAIILGALLMTTTAAAYFLTGLAGRLFPGGIEV